MVVGLLLASNDSPLGIYGLDTHSYTGPAFKVVGLNALRDYVGKHFIRKMINATEE